MSFWSKIKVFISNTGEKAMKTVTVVWHFTKQCPICYFLRSSIVTIVFTETIFRAYTLALERDWSCQ